MTKFFFAILFFVFSALPVSAQNQNETSEGFRSWKRGTAIVLFSGVGGGVLGISTLSFYGEPQEHTSNITIGALAGALAGLGFVLFQNSEKAPAQTWTLRTQNGSPALGYTANF